MLNDRLENKLTMYRLYKQTCNTHQSVWQNIKAFRLSYDDFKQLLNRIEEKVGEKQTKITTGVTKGKNKLKKDMGQAMDQLIGPLRSYASLIGDQELLSNLSHTVSKVVRMRDTLALKTGENLYKLAANHQDIWEDYGINQQMMDNLNQTVKEFSEILSTPREIGNAVYVLNKELKELFTQTDSILKNRLDTLSTIFKGSNPSFYENYHRARRIVHD